MQRPPDSRSSDEPILILAPPGSGASAIAGLLYHGCGISMGELVAPTFQTPYGSFDEFGISAAHEELLAQMERDITCPPTAFDPGQLDLTALKERLDEMQQSPDVWAVKDAAATFLLPAWAATGIGPVRLVAVVRRPYDAISSVVERYRIPEFWAEAAIDAYLGRLAELARLTDLAVVEFSDSADEVLGQVGDLANRLGQDWDEPSAAAHFDASLVQQSLHFETTPAFDQLLKVRHDPTRQPIQATDLCTIEATSVPTWPLATHVGGRAVGQQNELWKIGTFRTVQNPTVAEVVLTGTPESDSRRPAVSELHRIDVTSPLAIGAELLRRRLRPDGVIAHGIVAGRSLDDVEYFLRSVHGMASPFAELVIDVPAPTGTATAVIEPAPPNQPSPDDVAQLATQCGWEAVSDERLSPGRIGMVLRKRVTDGDGLDSMSAVLAIHGESLAAIERRLESLDPIADNGGSLTDSTIALNAAVRRAESAERDLRRLRARRSVRFALAATRPFRRLFRAARGFRTPVADRPVNGHHNEPSPTDSRM